MGFIFKRFIKCVLTLCVIVAIFYVIIISLLNSTNFYEYIIPKIIEKKYSSVQIDELKISKSSFHGSDIFKWSDIHGVMKIEEQRFNFDVPDVEVSHLIGFLRKKEKSNIKVNISVLSSKAARIESLIAILQLGYDENSNIKVEGVISSEKMELSGYQVNNAKVDIVSSSNHAQYMLRDSLFYEGVLTSFGNLEFSNDQPFVVEVNLDRVNFEDMQYANEGLRTNFNGYINAQLIIKGNKKEINQLTSKLSSEPNSKVKGSIIGLLHNRINMSLVNPDKLSKAINNNEFISLDSMNVELSNVGQRKLDAQLELLSRQYFLDDSIEFDINLDGDLRALLKMIFSKDKTGSDK